MSDQQFYTDAEMILVDRALKVIEVMAENYCSGPTNHKDDCPFCEIYTIAHAGRSPSCRTSHIDWEGKINKLYEEFKNG